MNTQTLLPAADTLPFARARSFTVPIECPEQVEIIRVDLTDSFKLAPRKYSKQWFIDFFTAIPEEKWCKFRPNDGFGRSCAFGHVARADGWNGIENLKTPRFSAGTRALADFGTAFGTGDAHVAAINDSGIGSPKQAVLNFLHSLPAWA